MYHKEVYEYWKSTRELVLAWSMARYLQRWKWCPMRSASHEKCCIVWENLLFCFSCKEHIGENLNEVWAHVLMPARWAVKIRTPLASVLTASKGMYSYAILILLLRRITEPSCNPATVRRHTEFAHRTKKWEYWLLLLGSLIRLKSLQASYRSTVND